MTAADWVLIALAVGQISFTTRYAWLWSDRRYSATRVADKVSYGKAEALTWARSTAAGWAIALCFSSLVWGAIFNQLWSGAEEPAKRVVFGALLVTFMAAGAACGILRSTGKPRTLLAPRWRDALDEWENN